MACFINILWLAKGSLNKVKYLDIYDAKLSFKVNENGSRPTHFGTLTYQKMSYIRAEEFPIPTAVYRTWKIADRRISVTIQAFE